MKKKHPRSPKRKTTMRPRNAATGMATATAARPRPRSAPRATAPDWRTIAAAVAGGAGSAALGGLVVNQQILSPEAVGIGLMLGGGATAYFSAGVPRVVGTSVAAAGAGQFALALMNKRALHAHGQVNAPAMTSAQLPPPAVASAPRRSASGGGVVVDLFREAASNLDTVEDEWRYGIRDDGYPDANGPVVIDLDAPT